MLAQIYQYHTRTDREKERERQGKTHQPKHIGERGGDNGVGLGVFGIEGEVAQAVGQRGGGRHDNGDDGDGREAHDADDHEAKTYVDEADAAEDGPAVLEVRRQRAAARIRVDHNV